MRAEGLPTGTITFLLTDVVGSTRMWQDRPDVMGAVIDRHNEIIENAVESHSGWFVKSKGEGDSTFSVFERPTDAIQATISAQQALTSEAWPETIEVKVRAALHTGEAELRHGDYYGTVVNRCARLRGLAHGGQVLCSQALQDLVADGMPVGTSLRALGTHHLRDLDRPEHVYQLVAPELPTDFPPLASVIVTNNLPAQRSSFVGRAQEIDEVRKLLETQRHVTLTGVGGCGKTRLALQVANELMSTFDDGVFFCDLAPLAEEGSVDRALAQAVQLAGGTGNIRGDLIMYLGPRRTLLIIDNCEHLLDATAELVDAILSACTDVKVLATSREALRVEGEHAYAVPSLAVPRTPDDLAQSESARLFVDRALAERPSFDIAQHADAVVDICVRLDGVPLAIELAASRVAHLTPEQINERLKDRFRLLTGGKRRVQRQQTLAAALDWSFDLLHADEQALLRRLSVFAGGFTLHAAEGVCDDGSASVLEQLGSLVAKSLVVTETRGGDVRYRMLETVRLYAEQKLVDAGEAEAYRARHRDWFLEWLESFTDNEWMTGPLTRDAAEIPNVRAAIEWSEGEGRPDLCARLAAATYPAMDGYPAEGMAWIDKGEPGFDDLSRYDQVRWLAMRGFNGYTAMALDRVYSLEHAVRLAGDEDWIAAHFARGLYAYALSYQVMLMRRGGGTDDRLVARTLQVIDEVQRFTTRDSFWFRNWVIAGCYVNLDLLDEAIEYSLETRRAGTVKDWEFNSMMSEGNLAVVFNVLGRHDEALEAAERADGFRQFVQRGFYGYTIGGAVGPKTIALAAVGRLDDAKAYLNERLPDLAELRMPLLLNSVVIFVAAMAGMSGDWERCAVLHASTTAAGAFFRDSLGFTIYRFYERFIDDHLSPEQRDAAFARGGRMSLQDALAYGLEVERQVTTAI